jgi:hypothetical protein
LTDLLDAHASRANYGSWHGFTVVKIGARSCVEITLERVTGDNLSDIQEHGGLKKRGTSSKIF